jgi:hypothetical protein
LGVLKQKRARVETVAIAASSFALWPVAKHSHAGGWCDVGSAEAGSQGRFHPGHWRNRVWRRSGG